MSIGINWKAIWKSVWKSVWRQTAPVLPPPPGQLPQLGGGRSIEGRGDAVYLPAPLFAKPRRVTSKVIPPEEPEPVEVPDLPPLDRAPVEYPFTAGDFFKASPAPPPSPPKPPRIRHGKVAFRVPVAKLRIGAAVVRVEGSVKSRITVRSVRATLRIPAVRLRASGYVRFRDDAIALATGRPDLEDALGEWVVK